MIPKIMLGIVCVFAFEFATIIFIMAVEASNETELNIGNLPLPPTPVNFSVFQELLERQQRKSRSGLLKPPCSTDALGLGKSFAKNGLIDSRYRWKVFNVYPDPSYSDEERKYINYAMYRLAHVLPCVNFGIYSRGTTPSGDYVHIMKKQGCWSYLGRQGGRQELSLEGGCLHVGVVFHELIHALGFDHEHNRYDRDDYVTIHWDNIQPGLAHAFNKVSMWHSSPFGVPYNERSIMHYESTAFSKNGWSPTITSKRGVILGRSEELQASDIQKLKKMYNC